MSLVLQIYNSRKGYPNAKKENIEKGYLALCYHCYNTLKNFDLHQISEPTLVLYIVITNIEIQSMCFL